MPVLAQQIKEEPPKTEATKYCRTSYNYIILYNYSWSDFGSLVSRGRSTTCTGSWHVRSLLEVLHQVCPVRTTTKGDGASAGHCFEVLLTHMTVLSIWPWFLLKLFLFANLQAIFKLALDILPKGLAVHWMHSQCQADLTTVGDKTFHELIWEGSHSIDGSTSHTSRDSRMIEHWLSYSYILTGDSSTSHRLVSLVGRPRTVATMQTIPCCERDNQWCRIDDVGFSSNSKNQLQSFCFPHQSTVLRKVWFYSHPRV